MMALFWIETLLGREQNCPNEISWLICQLEESVFMETAETFGFLVALILFVLDSPDRQKQSNYDAWKAIDGAHGVETSYARIEAMQDLNARGVNLRGLDAVGADLTNIRLDGAKLTGANLKLSILQGANLRRTHLELVNFQEANLQGVNLQGANLRRANLRGADLRGANLQEADLREASFQDTNLDGAILSGAKGLEFDNNKAEKDRNSKRLLSRFRSRWVKQFLNSFL
ncbi:MAG: pentapeptide repeat-containing protein [Cyanobacteria bacterium P01_H01_bin.58]